MEKVSSNKKSIYICCTYYHLLISIIKALTTNNKCDLLLSTTWHDFVLVNNKELINKLKESNIFGNVIIDDVLIDERKKIIKSKIKEIKKFFILQKINKNFSIDLYYYDEIYLFSYNNPLGRMMNKNKIYHNLLEDGTDCYKNNKVIIKSKLTFKNFIKKYLLNLDDLGESKYTKSIEVNDARGIEINNKKIIEKSKKEMFEKLTDIEKQKIISLFTSNNNWKELNNMTVIITQPFYMDGILKTEKEQLKLYKDVIAKYVDEDNVIIKTHPRDNTDYSKIIKKSNIIKDAFPIEILNFTNIKLKKIITITSTSINLIYNCNEKIYLGWDWLNEWKKINT